MKGFVIAGTNSGCGKTTISLAMMAYFTKKNYIVAPFKVGPDFIDPGHHTRITGKISRNLDGWMLDKNYNSNCFLKAVHNADIAIVEGVMGLFDGYDGKSEAGSTAQMAKWINLPIILIVNAKSMARSAAALVQGFENFDKNLNFAGVIFNNIGSKRHLDFLKEAMEHNVRMPCLGGILRNQDIEIPERHLGLVTNDEYIQTQNFNNQQEKVSSTIKNTNIDNVKSCKAFHLGMVNKLSNIIENNIDIKGLLKNTEKYNISLKDIDDHCKDFSVITKKCEQKTENSQLKTENFQPSNYNNKISYENRYLKTLQKGKNRVRLGVARDKAFCFYYKDNLEILEEYGAELLFFSPMDDKKLPSDISGIYFGGGYPELFSEKLSKNYSLIKAVKEKSVSGMPIYGECGGFMYLCKSIKTLEEKKYAMTGCFPFHTSMLNKLKALGYRDITLKMDSIIGIAGEKLKGHEFHYSQIDENVNSIKSDTGEFNTTQNIYNVKNRKGVLEIPEGYLINNTLGSYIHIHMGSNFNVGKNFIDSCRKF